jgi:copper chaperone CopZ
MENKNMNIEQLQRAKIQASSRKGMKGTRKSVARYEVSADLATRTAAVEEHVKSLFGDYAESIEVSVKSEPVKVRKSDSAEREINGQTVTLNRFNINVFGIDEAGNKAEVVGHLTGKKGDEHMVPGVTLYENNVIDGTVTWNDLQLRQSVTKALEIFSTSVQA